MNARTQQLENAILSAERPTELTHLIDDVETASELPQDEKKYLMDLIHQQSLSFIMGHRTIVAKKEATV